MSVFVSLGLLDNGANSEVATEDGPAVNWPVVYASAVLSLFAGMLGNIVSPR